MENIVKDGIGLCSANNNFLFQVAEGSFSPVCFEIVVIQADLILIQSILKSVICVSVLYSFDIIILLYFSFLLTHNIFHIRFYIRLLCDHLLLFALLQKLDSHLLISCFVLL